MEFCKCCKLPKSIICKKCKTEKSTDQFHAGRKMCKNCRSTYNQKRYVVRKDKVKVVKPVCDDAKIDENPICDDKNLIFDDPKNDKKIN
jgi:hypothetical protein